MSIVIENMEQRQTTLFAMFCQTRIIIDKETGRLLVERHWTNEEARQTFERLTDLILQQRVEEEKQYATHYRRINET